jgi:hypothetical protein
MSDEGGYVPRIDNRLVGQTAENIFLSLLNQQGIFATAFNTVAFDGIVFDIRNRYFKVGDFPFYVQIKCRGSHTDEFNPQGFPHKTFDDILELAAHLTVPKESLYFVVGFFKGNDIRNIVFFGIPFGAISRFETAQQYRFSVKRCSDLVSEEMGIFRI